MQGSIDRKLDWLIETCADCFSAEFSNLAQTYDV